MGTLIFLQCLTYCNLLFMLPTPVISASCCRRDFAVSTYLWLLPLLRAPLLQHLSASFHQAQDAFLLREAVQIHAYTDIDPLLLPPDIVLPHISLF